MKAYQFKSIIFKTGNANYYVFSQSLGCVLYLHPIILYCLCKSGQYMTVDKCDICDNSIDISMYSKKEIEYYIRKLELYIELGIFSCIEKENVFLNEIKEKDVVDAVVNTEQLAIELVQNCNLSCVYCIYGKLYKNPFKYGSVDVNVIKKVLDYLCIMWHQSNISKHEIRINYYGGEPLLKFKEIENITSYLKSKKIDNVKFTFGLTTNATLLKEEIVKYFVDNDFVIAISIDGDEQSNSYRIYKNETKTYNDIYRNIEFVKNNYPEYFKKNVHFISVLHDKNCDFDIRNYFLSEFGVNRVNIGALNRIDLNEDRINDFERMFRPVKGQYDIVLNKTVYKLYKEVLKFNNNYPFPEKNETKLRRRNYTGTCVPLKKKLFITADYLLMPCEKISFDVNFGFIFKNGKVNNIDFKKISDFHNRNLRFIMDECKKCYYSEMCTYCIYTLNKDKKGDCHCDKYMDKKKFSSFLSMLLTNIENNQ